MLEIVCHDEIPTILSEEIRKLRARQYSTDDPQRTAVTFELNKIGSSFVSGHSITGINIHAADNICALNELFSLAASSKLYAPFGTTSSVFVSNHLPESEVNKRLEKVRKHFAENKSEVATAAFDCALAHGSDKQTFRCHIGKHETVFPLNATNADQAQITVSVRSSDANYTVGGPKIGPLPKSDRHFPTKVQRQKSCQISVFNQGTSIGMLLIDDLWFKDEV